MSGYTIRKLEHTEFDILVPLMQDCFGMDVNVGYFNWKFIDNPAGAVVGFVAIAEDGEVAGYYGVIPETYVIDGKEKLIYQSGDTMTHSKHRRRGLFEKLALHCYDYLRKENKLFVIGFGGEKSTPGLVKFGWVHLFDVRYYFLPRVLAVTVPAFFPDDAGKLEELPFSEIDKISSLVSKTNDQSCIHANKTMDVFKWRMSNPLRPCKVLIATTAGAPRSYLCYYWEDRKIILMDYYFGAAADGKKLIAVLKRKVRSERAKGIIAFCQEDGAFVRPLRRYGFIHNPFAKGRLSFRTPFMVFSDTRTMNELLTSSRWNITPFDHDAL